MPDPTTPRPTRHLSPPYPSIDLQTAIAKAHLFFSAHRRNAVGKETAVQSLGYRGSSHGNRALAAMLAFGLLEDQPGSTTPQVRLSALALSILLDEDDGAQRGANLREAALKPPIYREMVNRWPNALPPDATMTKYLQGTKNYNANITKALIRNFRATYALAQLGSVALPAEEEATPQEASPPAPQTAPVAAPLDAVEPPEEQEAAPAPPAAQSKPNALPANQGEEEKFIVPLLSGRRLVVRYPKVLAESEVQMVESAFAMIRASIGAG